MKKTIVISACLVSFLAAYSQVKDIDGNAYKTIKLGTQTWTAENLRTTRLNDGTPIQKIEGDEEFLAANAPAFAWYKNDTIFRTRYGILYNWHAVKTGKLCPAGWHVASDDEWITLERTLGMSVEDALNLGDRGTDQGQALKSTTGWESAGSIKPSGFAALPAGVRADDGSFMWGNDGSFFSSNYGAYFWTSTEKSPGQAYYRSTGKNEKTIMRINCSTSRGHSVRCLKD